MNFILDSGAYSAARSGKPIDLGRYCDYLLANRDWLTYYVALDVFTSAEPEIGARVSWGNYQIMRERGLDPIAVFHFGEDIKWLHRYLDAGASYIALGGTAVLSSKTASLQWYDAAWQVLSDPEGRPLVKVHAFGEANPFILHNFPWQSADTASWIQIGKTQGFLLNGVARGAGSVPAQEIAPILAKFTRATPKEFYSPGRLGRALRTYMNAVHYIELQRSVRARARTERTKTYGFFKNKEFSAQSIDLDPFNMYLSISVFPQGVAVLNALSHPSRLATFFYQENWRALLAPDASTAYNTGLYKEYCDILKEYLL